MASDRKSRIGTIEVVQYTTNFVRQEWRKPEDTEFDQANKKDARDVTKGRHTMSTTKKGKVVKALSKEATLYSVYDIGHEISRLSLHYHMAHTLEV